MAPETSKRRKLEDGETAEVADAAQNDSATASAETTTASAQTTAVAGMKRNREQSASAPYSGESYKSSLFKLQVDEMLSEVKPDYTKRFAPVDNALRKLKTLIEAIPGREPAPFHDATKAMRKKSKVTVPHPEPAPPADTHYKLAYAAPSDVNVVGSYPLRTMTKGDENFSVDMVVTMPASILEEKDYLNHRYFYKRAYYLSCIAAGIQEDKTEAFDLSFENMHGNDLQPVLIVKSGKGQKATDFSKSKCEIRIIPACPEGYFVDKKLEPGRNAIRPKAGPDGETSAPNPTPFYNASLRADCNYRSYLKLLHQATKKAEGFVDACVLGNVWLRQRGFGSTLSNGGFGHFEWAALTALLLQGGGPKGHTVLSPGYSSYQLFKGVVQYLATSNFVAKPMFFQANEVSISKTGLPIFYDGPRGHNILFKMSASSYESLKEEAKVSIEMLNDETFDQFESTFILKKDNPLQKFDSVIKIDGSNANIIESDDHRDQTWLLCNKIYATLKEALVDRVKLVQIKSPQQSRWGLKSTSTPPPAELLAGIINDPEHVNRAVDHGPAAEDKKAAAKFRRFWGEKAELRRFKDGSILESLVWQKSAQASISEQIIAYVLYRHTGINPNSDLDFVGEEFGSLLSDSENAAAAFGALREELRNLERHIRELEDIPLQLKQVSAIGADLRSTSLNVPIYSPRAPLATPAEVIINFEGSGRWPDDIIAISRTKIAFLVKVAELLEEAGHGYKCSVGIENEDFPLLNCSLLDIVAPSGAAFRLRIHNEREEVLLQQMIKSKTTSLHDKDAAVAALAVYKYMFDQLPLHTQSVNTHITRFPLLSPTIRMVKKWFSCHLLTSHIREEFIELLVLRVFLQPYPWRAPSSAMTGFLRTLQFIGRWDWRATPLVVDFSGTMAVKDIQAIQTRLDAWRKIDPAMNRTIIMAASNHDNSGTAFTDGMPSKVIASRMTALARSATKMVKDQALELEAKTLFAPSLAEYDFVIQLAPKFSNGRKGKVEKKTSGFKNLEIQSDEDLMFVGYEPVKQYVKELEKAYGNAIVLLYNGFNGGVIAGLWAPGTAARAWRVNMAYATKMVDGERAGIDKESIVAEMARLGGDMVAKIELRR